MVSVIIPALNEQDTIANVVKFCLSHPEVTEVIVVDDKSVDDTVQRAKAEGAKVITSSRMGKGISMKEGVQYAKNDILVFIDGDIDPYPPNTISDLTAPVLSGEYDFIKATFARNAGRVTELVAKPLLSIFYPELAKFSQPLSGMIAGKKILFEKIKFFNGYGVDVGILIDMFNLGARITEVNIGYLDNKSKPWHALTRMSKEVASAIISKAMTRKKGIVTLQELETMNSISDQMEYAIREQVKGLKKMAVFDMDNTILNGRFIDACASAFGFTAQLQKLRASSFNPIPLTKHIAQLLKGLSFGELLRVAESIPIVSDVEEVFAKLRERGYIIGIISDSYDFVTTYVKNRTGADFSLSNELEFSESIVTGEVKLPSFFFNHSDSICNHALCKTNALQHIAKKYHVSLHNCVAMGDSANDRCMIRKSGIGIAFCSSDKLLNYEADQVITGRSFAPVLNYAQ